MKVPTSFVPSKNLEKKVEQALSGEETLKRKLEEKRVIHIAQSHVEDLKDDTISACIIPVVTRGRWEGTYDIELKSNNNFYFPFLDDKQDWTKKERSYGVAYGRDETGLALYFEVLRDYNDAILVWKNENMIYRLKDDFERLFPYSAGYSMLRSEFEGKNAKNESA